MKNLTTPIDNTDFRNAMAEFTTDTPWLDAARLADHDQRVAAFASCAAQAGINSRGAYIALREKLRYALREAAKLQKARRRRELEIREEQRENGYRSELGRFRESIHLDRIDERRTITRLIALRHAGRAWSKAQAAERRENAA